MPSHLPVRHSSKGGGSAEDWCRDGEHNFSGLDDGSVKTCASPLLRSYFTLTMAQSCDDWLTIRQFRVRETNASIILRNDREYLEAGEYSQITAREKLWVSGLQFL